MDFARIRYIERCITHDAGGRESHRRGIEQGDPFSMPGAVQVGHWAGIMQTILDLPVPTWIHPVDVAGEISSERKAKSMGILNDVDDAKSVEDRFPFLPDGRHRLVVTRIFEFKSKKHGDAAGTEMVLLESDNPSAKVGQVYCNLFFVKRAPKFVGDTQELDRFVDFCGKVKGVDNLPAAKQATRLFLTNQDTQPARGVQIVCEARTQVQLEKGTKQPKRDATTGKELTYSVRSFEVVTEQTEADVTAARAELDAAYPIKEARVTAPAAVQQATQPAPVQPTHVTMQVQPSATLPVGGAPKGNLLGNLLGGRK